MTDETGIVPHEGSSLMQFGQTQLDPGDLIMPRIKILQAQSEEVGDGQGNAGEFFNTLTSVNFGDVLRFVPIVPFKQRVFLVREERLPVINVVGQASGLPEFTKDDAGLACRSYDMEVGRGKPGIACAECPFSQWRDKEPPLCTETYNVAASTEEGELIVLSLAKSAAREGKKLFSMIRMRPNARGTIFEATTKAEKAQGKGSYYVPVITPKEQAPTELLRQVNTWAQQLAAAGPIDVSPEGIDDEDGGAASDGNQPF